MINNANGTYNTTQHWELVPEVVTGKEGDLEKGEILGITYSNLIPVLAKAIQEQQKQIERTE